MLQHGASPNAVTKDQYTPLHIAAKEGHEEVASVLLEHDANLNLTTKVSYDNVAQFLQQCCNQGPVVHASPYFGKKGHEEVASVLLEHDANLNLTTNGSHDNVVLLLQQGASPNAVTKDQYTPLHITAKEGHEGVTSVLLEHDANLNLTTKVSHDNVVLLLQHGASPNAVTKDQYTPLHITAKEDHAEVASVLLEHDANLNLTTKVSYDNVVLLLQHRASPNAVTKDQYTPLHIAAKEGHEEVASVLLEHDAILNLTTKVSLHRDGL